MGLVRRLVVAGVLAGSLSLILVSPVSGQHAGMGRAAAISLGSAGRAAAISGGRAAIISSGQTSGNISIIINNNSGSGATNIPVTSSFFPVPGLGFDIPHLAATRGAAAVGALPGQFSGTTFGTAFLGGGFFIPTTPTIVVQVPPIVIQQPIIMQQPATEDAEAPEVRRPQTRKPAAVEEAPPEPVREVPEYVFLRRDGTTLFAVAYMWEKDRLLYVTREGLRRSVETRALDLDATRKFNEERGLTFRLPA